MNDYMNLTYNPYAGMLEGMQPYQAYNPQQSHLANLDAQRQREEEERQQSQQSWNNFSNDMMDYMNGGQAGQASPYTAGPELGMAGGSGAAGVNAAGGTLQASMAAPLAQAAPLASQTGIAGGTVVGPMSQAPVAGMSMAGGAPAAGAGAGAGAGGAGAGAGSAAAGAGAGALGTAAMVAAPVAAAIGAMNWVNNTNDDITWGTHFTNPAKAHSALDVNVNDMATRWFGDNDFGEGMGSLLAAPSKIVAPDSPGEFVEGIGDSLGINQTAKALGGAWDWLSGLFG